MQFLLPRIVLHFTLFLILLSSAASQIMTSSGFSPHGGPPGTTITITGAHFGNESGLVGIGGEFMCHFPDCNPPVLWSIGTPLTVVLWTDTLIQATVAPETDLIGTLIVASADMSNSVEIGTFYTDTTFDPPVTLAPSTATMHVGETLTLAAIGGNGNPVYGLTSWASSNPSIVTLSSSDPPLLTALSPGTSTITVSNSSAVITVAPSAPPPPQPPPAVSGMSPTSGPVGTEVTILGENLGATQPVGSFILLGSEQLPATYWSDTSVRVTIPETAITGVVSMYIDGNFVSSGRFTVTGKTQIQEATLSPSQVSMVVDESRTLDAFDSNGNPMAGLSWSTSDPSIVNLSTDDPPVLTAVGTGVATITAGDASADVSVYAGPELPEGTQKWFLEGDGNGSILVAVPSPEGVADVFTHYQSGKVQAIAADGHVAWIANAPANASLLPDFQGGLVIQTNGGSQPGRATQFEGTNAATHPQTLTKLDGRTGQPYPSFTYLNPPANGINPVAHTNGTIFTVDGDTLIGINPKTGMPTVSKPLHRSTYSYTWSPGTIEACPTIVAGPPVDLARSSIESLAQTSSTPGTTESSPEIRTSLIIAGDGYAYLAYTYTVTNVVGVGGCDGELHEEDANLHLRLLRLAPDGSGDDLPVADWNHHKKSQFWESTSSESGSMPVTGGFQFADLITDADHGATMSWRSTVEQFCHQSTHTTSIDCRPPEPVTTAYHFSNLQSGSSGATIADNLITLSGQAAPVQATLQAENGAYIGTVGIGPEPGNVSGYKLVSISPNGQVTWIQPLSAYSLPKYALANGNFIYWTVNPQTHIGENVTIDSTGQELSRAEDLGTQGSWFGNNYQIGAGVFSIAALPRPALLGTWAAIWPGNHSLTPTAKKQMQLAALDSCHDTGSTLVCPQARDVIWAALKKLRERLADPTRANALSYWVFNKIFDRNSKAFEAYLGKGLYLLDGTKSEIKLCDSGLVIGSCTTALDNKSVSKFFKEGKCDTIAATILNKSPFTMFADIQGFSFDSYGETDLNIAIVFHEGLHAYTHYGDSQLMRLLGCPDSRNTDYITQYLRQFISAGPIPPSTLTCSQVGPRSDDPERNPKLLWQW